MYTDMHGAKLSNYFESSKKSDIKIYEAPEEGVESSYARRTESYPHV